MSTLMYKSGSSWIDVIHPVGSVWLSNSSTSPSSLFGGTWQQLTNAVLRAAAAYGYNGSDNMTLTISNMPSHTHTPSRRVLVYSNEDYGNLSINTVGTRISSYGYILDKGHGSSISNTGSTGGGNHSRNCLATAISIAGSELDSGRKGVL